MDRRSRVDAFDGLDDACDVLHGSGLVVDRHHRHDRGLVVDQARHLLGVDPAVPVDVRRRHLTTEATQEPGCLEDRLVFGGSNDDSPTPAGGEGCTLHRQVVGFGAASGEDDLLGTTAEQHRGSLTR